MAAQPPPPTVSVGLPVHQGEAFIAEAIRSLLSQVDVDLELVVADNGSTDATEEICRDLLGRDPRARYLRSEVNRGAAWNYNRLVHSARGRYFKWAAHDDVHAPAFLARCVEVLEARPEVSLCYTRAVDIDVLGRVLKVYDPLQYAQEAEVWWRARAVLHTPTPCFEAFGLVRRAQLQQTRLIGPYSSSDRTLLFELALRGGFHEVPEVLFHHRQHPGRSVHRYRGARARDLWFDPDHARRLRFPQGRLVWEHLRAVDRAPLTATERLAVYRELRPWVNGMARPLVREMMGTVGRAALRRSPGQVGAWAWGARARP